MSSAPSNKQAAKPATADAGAKQKTGKGKASQIGWFSLIIGIALASAFFASTSLLIIAGMLPTLVAFATDRTRSKSGALSISVLNFAGTLPFIINLWRSGQGLETAVMMLTQPYTWLVMYGMAAIGWSIYHYLPKFVATYVAYRAQGQLEDMQKLQKKLIEKWGPSVKVLAIQSAGAKKQP